MEAVDDLTEIIETAIFSAYVQGERPLSVLVVARVESGKSELVLRYCRNSGIAQLDDMTAWALTNPKREIFQKLAANEVHHIICPDFLKPLARNRDTVSTLVTFLIGLMEEGTMHIQTYATNLALPKPLRCGLITTIAKEELEVHRHQWKRIGFMSRLLPVSYSYSPSSVTNISHSISQRKYLKDEPVTLSLPAESVLVTLPSNLADEIERLVPHVVAQIADVTKLYGFRLQKQLQTFTMAHALRDGRTTATKEDFDAMSQLTKYLNLKYTQI